MQKTVQFLIYLVCADVTGAYINTVWAPLSNMIMVILHSYTFLMSQEYESDVDEETRQFILDQNTETRKLFNDAVNI